MARAIAIQAGEGRFMVATEPPPAPRQATGLLLGLLGVAIFAGTLPFTRLAVAALDPIFVTAGRAALSGLIAGAVLLAMRRRPPPPRDLVRLALTALCVAILFPGFTGFAARLVEASHGGVVLGLMPLATAAVSALIAGERPSRAFWAAAILGAGIVVGFALAESGGHPALGDLLLLAAVAVSAYGYVVSGQVAREGMPGWEVISWILVLALPLTLPVALWSHPAMPEAVPASAWIGFAYVTLMSQYVGFFAWNAGLALGGIARVSQMQLLQTFLTLGIAAAVNGERVGPTTWLVALVVVAVVVAAQRARVRRVR